jgi:cysteinyl-tRNA synthetase
MATALLGPQLDIHCGGVDNIFPHHEAEIAQSECFTGKKFVKHWLHCAHLMVDGQKMSKSLGNFYTLRDLLARGYSGREIRFALITVHYRLPLNFTLSGLDAARAALVRLDAWIQRLRVQAQSHTPEPTPESTAAAERFLASLDDDLNISAAMGHLFDWLRESNKAMDLEQLSTGQAAQTLLDFEKISSILALEEDAASATTEVLSLLEERQKARSERNWARSDEIRDAIALLGWTVKDTKQGPQLVRV